VFYEKRGWLVKNINKTSLRGPKGRGNLLPNTQNAVETFEIAAVAALLRNDMDISVPLCFSGFVAIT